MTETPTIPYRTVVPLDRGGPFEVWRIEPLADDRSAKVGVKIPVPVGLAGPPLALKCLPFGSPDAHHLSEVLRREARLQAQVAHLGIVPVALVEVGQRPAIVSPLAWGSLDTLPIGQGTWPLRDAAAALRRLADALAALHVVGIVHGDVAPTNVLLLAGDEAALPLLAFTDFECAAEQGRPGPVRGTPGAVAPEVVAGDAPSPASDVFGLGRVGQALLAAADPGDESETRACLEAWCANLTDPDPRRRPTAAVAAATVPAGLRVRTVEFGPRPRLTEPDGPSASGGSRTVRAAIVATAAVGVVLVVLALVGGTARARRHPEPCRRSDSPGMLQPRASQWLDMLGTDCAQQVTWSGTVLTVRALPDPGVHRYRLGRRGDVVAIAAWGCKGRPRPTLYRPARGEILDYAALPTHPGTAGATSPRRRFGVVANGRARVASDPRGCLQLVVTKRVPRVPPGR